MNRSFSDVFSEGDFEVRFFAALGALASVLLHALGLLLFSSGSTEDPPPPPIVVEIVSEPRDTTPGAESLPKPPPPAGVEEPRAQPAESVSESEEPPTDYRELLRRRERAFQQDMAVRRERIAALETFLDERRLDERRLDEGAPAAEPGAANAISLCGAHDAGTAVVVSASRSMARYADLTPVGLFPPRYLEEVLQVAREGGALGRVEMALPPREVIVQLDEPEGAIFAVGRRDASCLVGFSWSRQIFPLRFRGLPARYVDADDAVRELVMDVLLHPDATFEITVVSGDELPFRRGALYDQEAVARSLEQRATGARLVRDFFGALFGG